MFFKLKSVLLKCPYYGFLMQCVTQLQVNENILQNWKSESALCIKLLSLKRKSRLWIIETSRFKNESQAIVPNISILPTHLLVFSGWSE